MKFTDVIQMNHEIGVIKGIAVSAVSNSVADSLFSTAKILEGIADKLMQEVMGNERISQD